MHIAEIDIPDWINGDEVEEVEHDAIDTCRTSKAVSDAMLNPDVWIYCGIAPPHQDPYWNGKLFLTLTVEVEGSYRLADVELLRQHEEGRGIGLPGDVPGVGFLKRGVLSVVDPMTFHWLLEMTANPSPYWIALQWEVPKEQAMSKARKIVAELGGRWLECDDLRYRNWEKDVK